MFRRYFLKALGINALIIALELLVVVISGDLPLGHSGARISDSEVYCLCALAGTGVLNLAGGLIAFLAVIRNRRARLAGLAMMLAGSIMVAAALTWARSVAERV